MSPAVLCTIAAPPWTGHNDPLAPTEHTVRVLQLMVCTFTCALLFDHVTVSQLPALQQCSKQDCRLRLNGVRPKYGWRQPAERLRQSVSVPCSREDTHRACLRMLSAHTPAAGLKQACMRSNNMCLGCAHAYSTVPQSCGIQTL
jgi:hypothetical protein